MEGREMGVIYGDGRGKNFFEFYIAEARRRKGAEDWG